MVTVHNFSYGLINPALAYLVSCLGAFLGLRCLTRARAHDRHGRAGWLSAAAFAVGACGIWAMHFIAMLGFTIPGQQISYNIPLTIASMVLAAAVVGVGLFIVGYGDGSWPRLVTAGAIVGLGVASMHYMGMAAMSMTDSMSYSPGLFGLSVLIAIVAGTAALWIGTWVRGLTATFAASLIMGVAVNGMHYTGMAALRVTKGTAGLPGMQVSGSSASSFVVPLVFGISLVALVLTLVVSLARTEEEIAEDALIDQRLKAAASREPIRAGIVRPATSARQAPGQPSAFTQPPATSYPVQPSAFTKAPATSNSVQPSAFTKAPATSYPVQPSAFTKAPPSGPPAGQPEYPADRGAGAPPPVDPLVTRVPGASGRRSAPPPVR